MAKHSRVLPAVQGDELTEALRSTGWKRVKTPPEVDHPLTDAVWRNEEADAFVAWIDERNDIGLYYGHVFGDGWAAGLKALVGTKLMIDGKTCIKTIQNAEKVSELGSAARALGFLAVGAFDADVHKVLSGLLASDNVDLQRDALAGISFSAWPQFESALDALIANPSTRTDVREEAEVLKENLAESNWSEDLR